MVETLGCVMGSKPECSTCANQTGGRPDWARGEAMNCMGRGAELVEVAYQSFRGPNLRENQIEQS